MSVLTSILSLIKPQTTDDVETLREAIAANADILDSAVRTGDARLLTTALQAALAGTAGTPGSGNKFVTAAGIGALATLNAVGSAQITDGSITAADIGAQQAWIAPTLINGWVAGAGLGYCKDHLGVVHFRGSVDAPSGGTTTAFQLPAGYRPSADWTGVLWEYDDSLLVFCNIVASTGNVVLERALTPFGALPAGGGVRLGPVHFPVW